MLMIPFLSSLSGFNQTSGDIGSKGLRYLLLRTERANVFLGRMIGTYIFTVVVLSVILLVTGLYLLVKVDAYPASDVVLWMLRGWLACAVFVLPWIALCAWVSAMMESPFLSLLITLGGLAFFVIVVWVLKMRAESAGYASYLTPWGFKWWLLHSNIGMFFAGIAVMLGFTALFTFLGLRTFHRRDV
jgi:ABC-type transport system involved in multi-copper enzyme maturation permease subunit